MLKFTKLMNLEDWVIVVHLLVTGYEGLSELIPVHQLTAPCQFHHVVCLTFRQVNMISCLPDIKFTLFLCR